MHGIEVSHGRVERIFPVAGESENTVWLPGVIALEGEGTEACPFNVPTIIDAIPLDLQAYSGLSPYWYSPFDLTALATFSDSDVGRLAGKLGMWSL